jgi:hypothetical protein
MNPDSRVFSLATAIDWNERSVIGSRHYRQQTWENLLCGCTDANKLLLKSGRLQTRFPVAAKIALQNAVPPNVRSFPFTLSCTISSPSSIQARSVERLQGRSDTSRLGYKLIA